MLISFVSLLLAHHCLHLRDVIAYIIRPAIRVFSPTDIGPGSGPALEFVDTLILYLFVEEYCSGQGRAASAKEADTCSSVVLPAFVQHCLQAKCQQLPLGYVIVLLKDLVRISVNRTGMPGSGNDAILGKVCLSVSVCVCVCECVSVFVSVCLCL